MSGDVLGVSSALQRALNIDLGAVPVRVKTKKAATAPAALPTIVVEPAPVVVQAPPTFRWRATPHRNAQGLIDYIDLEPVEVVVLE